MYNYKSVLKIFAIFFNCERSSGALAVARESIVPREHVVLKIFKYQNFFRGGVKNREVGL